MDEMQPLMNPQIPKELTKCMKDPFVAEAAVFYFRQEVHYLEQAIKFLELKSGYIAVELDQKIFHSELNRIAQLDFIMHSYDGIESLYLRCINAIKYLNYQSLNEQQKQQAAQELFSTFLKNADELQSKLTGFQDDKTYYITKHSDINDFHYGYEMQQLTDTLEECRTKELDIARAIKIKESQQPNKQ